MNRHVPWDGKSVGLKHIKDGTKFMEARKRYGFRDICPLCRQVIQTSSVTSVELVVSNQVGIPNKILHHECVEDKTDEYVVQLLASDYANYKASLERFAAWVVEPH